MSGVDDLEPLADYVREEFRTALVRGACRIVGDSVDAAERDLQTAREALAVVVTLNTETTTS